VDLQGLIIRATTHPRVQEGPKEKRLHVSQITQDAHLLALKFVHGSRIQPEINEMTLGTMFHEGALALITRKLKEEGVAYASEFQLCHYIEDWQLVGHPDLAVFPEDGKIIVCDLKLTSSFTYQKYLKNQLDHAYTYQLNWYRFMIREAVDGDFDIQMRLLFFIKNVSTSFSADIDRVYYEVEVPLIENERLLSEARGKIKQINAILEKEFKFSKCDDVYMKSGVPTRCQKYCSYNDVCPFYQSWLASKQQ